MKFKKTVCYILSILMLVSAMVPQTVAFAAGDDDEQFTLSRDYLT